MRQLSNHGHNLPGYIIGTAETQEFLTKLKAHPFLPAGADELLKVNSIREHRSHFAIVGLVRHPKRRTIRRTYLLFMGCREEGALLLQLERRQKTELLSSPRLERNTVFFFAQYTDVCYFYSSLRVQSSFRGPASPIHLFFLPGNFLSLVFLCGIFRNIAPAGRIVLSVKNTGSFA